MTKQLFTVTGTVATLVVAVISGVLIRSKPVRADDGDSEESKIQQGFAIAPVPLNLTGKNRALVGLGSYLVNALGNCNGCHTSPDIGPLFAVGGNPFFGQLPTVINPKSYLGGGMQFGPFPGSGPGGAGPLII
jgi:hypothetical protein